MGSKLRKKGDKNRSDDLARGKENPWSSDGFDAGPVDEADADNFAS